MNRKDWRNSVKTKKIVISYLYSRRYCIVIGILFELAIVSLFYLYKMPKGAINYLKLYSLTLLLIIVCMDYYKFCKTHRMFEIMKKKKYFTEEELLISGDLIERDYKEVLSAMYREKIELTITADKNREEMLDYYTMWAHQIKTPIAALGVLLQTEQLDQKKSELVQELFKIEQYVDMVLQFLRLEDNANDLLIKQVKLYPIVRQAVLKYANSFFYRKISLNLEEFECNVLTDEKWVVFVLEQLLSNALKYTKQGSVSIYLLEQNKNILVIEDTGIGIQAEDIPRIFERGYTGFNGRMNQKSTGIGLYLVKKICLKLSHKIWVESKVKQGTKVFLSFEVEENNMIE